jgi:hypothetical protein
VVVGLAVWWGLNRTRRGKIVLAAPSPAGGYEALAVVQSNFSSNLRLGSQEGIPVEAVAVNS